MIDIKEQLKKYEIFPQKKFSQNFIFDKNILDKIVNSVHNLSNFHVIEIGPGPGTLTSRIKLANPKSFCGIEIDIRFEKILNSMDINNSQFLFNDVLKIDFKILIKNTIGKYGNADFVVFSNLPYKISSQIMFKLYEYSEINFLVLLFQKEMADRIIAKPFSKDYGKITVLSKFFYDIKKVMDISANVFYPVPDVTSTLLKFTRKSNNKCNINFDKFNKLLTIAFSARRKQLKNNLKKVIKDVGSFDILNLSENVRAEELDVDEYLDLYSRIEEFL